jgi:phosphohistidine phosphatase SixA
VVTFTKSHKAQGTHKALLGALHKAKTRHSFLTQIYFCGEWREDSRSRFSPSHTTTRHMADLQAASPPPPKTIYLIRHGVAKHNIPDASGNRPDIANDASLTDSPLVRQGELQAQVLGEHLRRRGIAVGMDVDSCVESVQLVVCSPLKRCIQTASYVFPGYFQRQQHFNRREDEMIGANANSCTSSESQHVILKEQCSVFCHHDIREAFGMHWPDKRRCEICCRFCTPFLDLTLSNCCAFLQPIIAPQNHIPISNISS